MLHLTQSILPSHLAQWHREADFLAMSVWADVILNDHKAATGALPKHAPVWHTSYSHSY